MWKPAVAMLAGVLALLVAPTLPSAIWLAAILPVAVLALAWKPGRWLVFMPLGFAWCWLVSEAHLATRLDGALEGRQLSVSGWVHSLPQSRAPG